VIFTIFHRIPPAVVLVKQTIPRISLWNIYLFFIHLLPRPYGQNH